MTTVDAKALAWERARGVHDAIRIVEEYGKVELFGDDARTILIVAQSRQNATVATLHAYAESIKLHAESAR